jgi:iron complex outermembrane receptor protein
MIEKSFRRTGGIPFRKSLRASRYLLALAGMLTSGLAAAADDALPDLGIQDLMNIEVTSVSKRAQKLSETAASVFVITGEDVRRSGARNIPEALRLAPGVDVAAIGGGRYAVTIRGGNSRFSNKLLVLIDGRPIYTPEFSGVFWEAENMPLENIERIEVIRGPGSAVWGANAVNGVVNIITRHTKDTQGAMVTAGGGTLDQGFATLRYGNHAFDDLTYRVYGKAETHAEDETPSGSTAHDGWRDLRSGFRADQDIHDGHLSMQGDVFHLSSGDLVGLPQVTPPYSPISENITQKNSGGDVLTRWDQKLSSLQDISLQAYYDFKALTLPYVADTQEKNLDLEFEHRIHLFQRNEISWGLDYRVTGDRATGSTLTNFTPSSRYGRIASAFVQDEIAVIPDTLRLTLGGKLEHDSYTGSHFMPNGGLLWDVNATNQAWVSVGRAIRTPSFGERASTVVLNEVIPPGAIGNPLPILPVRVPDPVEAEHLLAYELGYRSQLAQTVSLDATAYINRYSHLLTSGAPGTPFPVFVNGFPAYLELPVPSSNNLSAREEGFELAADWRVLDNWRLQGSYTFSEFHFDEPDLTGTMDSSPRNIFSLRSSATLVGTQVDLWLRHTGERVATAATPKIDAYTTLDAAFSWHLPYNFDVSLVGKDLLDRRHAEIVSNYISSEPIAIQRSAYLKVTWTY